MRPALAALALLFLAAHLPLLPPSLEDIDSINFALAVRDFDVAGHQPHPPGYPVYVALARISTAALGGAGDPQAVVRGLAIWSALAGAALVPLLFLLFRAVGGDDRWAWWGMALAAASPLLWFTALRPLSDTVGLAAAVAAQIPLVHLLGVAGTSPGKVAGTFPGKVPATPGGLLAAGAAAAGVAAGIRVQTVMLTAPLLLVALALPGRGLTLRARLGAVAAGLAGVLVWAVPLVVLSGGPGGYLAALGSQAGEDFGGVVMLWTTRSPRVAADAAAYSFLWPWGGLLPGAVVVAAAALGTLRLRRAAPRALVLLALAFGPYAAFHLLFHETATIRYALPLVLPTALLAAAAFDWAGRWPAAALTAAVVAFSLAPASLAARRYAASEAPAFQAMRAVEAAAGDVAVGQHAVYRRPAEWLPPGPTILTARHGREWLALVERWRAHPDAPIAFVADPRRTDLALFDPRARDLRGAYRWPLPQQPYVGGIRPGATDWYWMRPPGWMLDRGWALSAEIGGVAARDAAGPHVQPSVAWARARPEQALLLVGGRNLEAEGASRITLARGDRDLESWTAPPGGFFRLVPLPAGTLAGDGYVALSIRAQSAGTVRVALEQFDLQPDGVEMAGVVEGWHEPEYNPATARAWRWMSERAVIWVRPVGREVVLTLSGESPLRYFEAAPAVRVSVGGREAARFAPTADFTESIRLPAAALEEADGRVLVESDRWFVPAEREESADRRRLALRIYSVAVAAGR